MDKLIKVVRSTVIVIISLVLINFNGVSHADVASYDVGLGMEVVGVKSGRGMAGNQAKVKVRPDYGKLPLYFEANQGQVDA
jgi:hypothetical protein